LKPEHTSFASPTTLPPSCALTLAEVDRWDCTIAVLLVGEPFEEAMIVAYRLAVSLVAGAAIRDGADESGRGIAGRERCLTAWDREGGSIGSIGGDE